jgi:hypothetical protein
LTRPRYEIIERVVSPKGEGAYPDFHDVAYVVYDHKLGLEVNVKATHEAAEEAIETRKKSNRRRKNARR